MNGAHTKVQKEVSISALEEGVQVFLDSRQAVENLLNLGSHNNLKQRKNPRIN